MTLTPEQKALGRRSFIKAAMALPAAGAFAWTTAGTGPVRTVLIGAGGMGQNHLKYADPDFVDIQAVVDIRSSARKASKVPNQYRDIDEFIKSEDSLRGYEACIIATPLHTHADIAERAIYAGLHVFCEKMMAKTTDGCLKMLDAAQRKNKVLQIGYQRFYNPLFHQAALMMQGGYLGDVYHIRGTWGLFGDRLRPVSEIDKKAVRSGKLIPKQYGYDNLEHLINWRMYRKYSEGYAAELLSHQVAAVNWLWGSAPVAVSGVGGNYQYKDGREIEDHMYLTYEYPDGRVFQCSSIMSNDTDGTSLTIYGTKGTIVINNGSRAYLMWRDDYKPQDVKSLTDIAMIADGSSIQAGASASHDQAQAMNAGTQEDPQQFNPADANRAELRGFAHAIRTGTPVLCDGVQGLITAEAIIKGNQAMQTGAKQTISLDVV